MSVDPSVPAAQRRLALEAFDRYKEDPSSISMASTLCRSASPDHVRHGALVLLEYWVRVHWTSLSIEQHNYLKEEVFFYMRNLKCILSEAPHVKQAICRVVVEIVKREWPQKWPEFMPNLLNLANTGIAQTEIVLLVLLRIVEDVMQLKTLGDMPRRRKDIYQSIISGLGDLMYFLFRVLDAHYLVPPDAPEMLKKSRIKLLESLLITLTGFIEFVQFKDFPLDEVIRKLCVLLNDPQLRVLAAKCLYEVPERKLKGAELQQLCEKFLQADIMAEILRSAAGSLSADTSENHAFLLALCGVIAGISKQVSSYIMETTKFECPPSFVELVMAVNKLCQHQSCAVARVALGAMIPLMKIQQKDSDKLVYPDELWHDIACTVVNRSSSDDSQISASNWDFEEESDMRKAFGLFKAELAELLRLATVLRPGIVLSQVGLGRLSDLLQKPPNEYEWSAISRYFDVACSTVLKEEIDIGDIVTQLMAAYDRVLPMRFADFKCQHHAISCCSSMLTVILPKDAEDIRLGNMLDAIFWMATYEIPGQNRQTRSNDVRDFRKHGTALLVRLAVDFYERLVKHFDKIRSLIARSLTPDSSMLQRQHFIEALLIISNGLNDPAAQLSISEQILSEEISFFVENSDLRLALTDVQNFAAYLGLLSVEDFERRTENRKVLSGKLMSITGALKRCKSVAGRHAVFELVARTCLNRLLKILWLFKDLFAQSIVHPDLVQSILCLGENEKYMIFGSNLPCCYFPEPRVPQARTFMTNIQENLTLFFVAISYRTEFYSLREDMGNIIINGFQNLPNYKMHQYIHLIVKSFVKNCPEHLLSRQLSSTFIPMMSVIYGYLKPRWDSQRNFCKDEETGATLEELIDDQVTHLMSRDLIEITSYFVIDSSKPPSVKTSDEVGAEVVAAMKSFGAELLADGDACRCVVTIAFSALYAGDSQTSFKSIALCSTLAFHLVRQEISPMIEELCVLMYKSLLLSLTVHGDNEAQAPLLLTLGVNLYRWLAPCARQHLHELLLSLGVRIDFIEKFEATFVPEIAISARRRKDTFRAMVEHLLGTSVSEMGKHQVLIKDHEPLWKMPKAEAGPIDSLDIDRLFPDSNV
ncbi:exportin-5 [Galendromus occidentalis]|uniref:Exportin-5 n=1 Tax=Galendromus occidentalis TaxID=34638 RepID=A0AAJ7L7W4_9ACAR|nr:exportin-5 [Galendromus occidentalis]